MAFTSMLKEDFLQAGRLPDLQIAGEKRLRTAISDVRDRVVRGVYEEVDFGSHDEWADTLRRARALAADFPLTEYRMAHGHTAPRSMAKIYFSDVPVFHYGHVRKPEAYERKKTDFHRWWHSDAELKKVMAKGEKREKGEKVLRYLGPHPVPMQGRIATQPPQAQKWPEEILAYGRKESLSQEFIARIQARVQWTMDSDRIAAADPTSTVLLEKLPFTTRLRTFGRHKSEVPAAMGSPQARPWSVEFRALLLLSEKGVAVR
jgi:hypothetical protein